ncbi:tetratricopeptide repeat protein [Oscillatoria sp. HE19RPO]|uniref:CHAT domain-containing tetratricopeptide repeat protein n=1 Tax=Oscillatoria sp. HE19RPO TaxID=2954806 RepID=UPI0020C27785|nr:tetratricopeptide repeat protein [Oscillatoria sp. HE19RPO]
MVRQALLLLSRPGLAIVATLLLGSTVVPTSSAQEMERLSELTGIGESWIAQNSSSAEGSAEGDRLLQEGLQLFRQGTAESLLQALQKWEAARQAYHAAGDAAREAAVLVGMGRIYSALGDKQTALDYFNQSLTLSRQVWDKATEAAILNNIGQVYSALEDKQTALDYLNQSLTVSRQVGDIRGEATTLNIIGGVYSELGDKQIALDYYNQSLPLFRQVDDLSWEVTTLNNIGMVYSELGDKQTALDYLNQSLPLSQKVGDMAQEARILNNIGGVYSQLGDKQTALDYYNQSLPLSQQVGDKIGEANTLNNIGRVYDDLGDKQTALDYYNQSLPLSRQVGDKIGEATTLNNIGKVYDELGDKQTALDYYNQSLPLSQQVGDKIGEATTLNNIGTVYEALGDNQTALDSFNQSLPLSRQVGDKTQEAVTLNNIGLVYYNLGDNQAALDYFNQSVPILRQIGDKGSEALSLSNLAVIKRTQSNLTEALTDMEAAIAIIEDLRTKIDSEKLRQSYFAQNQAHYELYIDLLMQLHQQNPGKGYDKQAFNASERARARTLLEILAEANADIRSGIDPELREKEINLQQRINATESRRMELFSGQHTPEQANVLKQEMDTLLRQLDELRAEIRRTSPRYAALTQPQPLTYEQVQQQVLDNDTLLLQYSLGEDRSFLWAVTLDSVEVYELPPRAEIEELGEQFYRLMQNPEYRGESRNITVSPNIPQINASATQLSQMLLSPVADKLAGKRLVVVPDGVLNFIPFAALPTPGQRDELTPLLVNHEIINLPSSSTLAILRQQDAGRIMAPKTVVLIADPVFELDDRRVTEQTAVKASDLGRIVVNRSAETIIGRPIPALPGTRQEAEAILALVPGGGAMSAFDFDASRATVANTDLTQYQMVHFATHGFVSSSNPELSGVVLSLVDEQGNGVDGFLRLHDIFNLQLNAQVVVLSACQTGLGDSIRGEGLVGLTRGFMYAGTPRLVVSLWNVDDNATAGLMSKFYGKMLSQNLTPTQALREAQLEMLASEEWKSPYFWAAFTLQGEWK